MRFSIVIIPDSQVTIQNWHQDAFAYGDWIKANTEPLNIRAVIGVGDITEWPRSEDWGWASEAYRRMGDVLVAPVDGNHDFDHWDDQTDEIYRGRGDRSLTNYQRAFPLSVLKGVVASFPEGRSGNMAQEFNAAGIKFLIISLNYVPRTEELTWAERTIQAFPNHKIILNTHDFMNQTDITETGDRIWSVLRRYPNVIMTTSGHWYPAAGHRVDQADDGHSVYHFMIDYQNYNTRKPNSFIQILTFDTSDLSISGKTYSPAFNEYMSGDENEFEIFGVDFLAEATEETPVTRPDEATTRRVADRIASVVLRWYPKASTVATTSSYRATEEDGGTWSQHNGRYYQGSPSAAVDFAQNTDVTGPYVPGAKNAASAAMRDFAKWWFDNFGDLTVEEFHTTPYVDDIGFNIKNQVKNTGDVPGHANHVHLATSDKLLDAIEARAEEKWGSETPVPTPDPTPTPVPPSTGLSEGLDYSFSRPSVAGIRAAGIKFVCRYLSQVNNATIPKILTRTEAQALSDAGILVVSNFEWYPERCTEGFSAGADDARVALTQAIGCGMPSGRPIYFSVDKDVDPESVRDYFDGINSILPRGEIGVYGSYRVVKALIEGGCAEWAWQTYAWSNGEWYPGTHIEQYQNGVDLAGGEVDLNRSRVSDQGGWFVDTPVPVPSPPPQPPPVPAPTPEPEPVPVPEPVPNDYIRIYTQIPSAATTDVPDRTFDQAMGDIWRGVHWRLPEVQQDISTIKALLTTEETTDPDPVPAPVPAPEIAAPADQTPAAPSAAKFSLDRYAKAIVAGIAVGISTYTAFKTGGVTPEEWQQIFVSVLGGMGLTWAVPNKTGK